MATPNRENAFTQEEIRRALNEDGFDSVERLAGAIAGMLVLRFWITRTTLEADGHPGMNMLMEDIAECIRTSLRHLDMTELKIES